MDSSRAVVFLGRGIRQSRAMSRMNTKYSPVSFALILLLPWVIASAAAPKGTISIPEAFEAADSGTPGPSQYKTYAAGAQILVSGSGITVEQPGVFGGKPLQIVFIGADPAALLHPLDRERGVSNYLTGSTPSDWRTGVARYGKVEALSVYPGIDVVFYRDQGRLEFDWRLAPGADAKLIRFKVDAADGTAFEQNGDLVFSTAGGHLCLRKPAVYQMVKGERLSIEARYVSLGEQEIGLQINAFDSTRSLVVDPALTFSSYFGQANSSLTGIAVDSSGYVYVTGETGNGTSLVIAKLDPSASQVIYATYIGVQGYSGSIAVDSTGQAYVIGFISSSFWASSFPLVNPIRSTPYPQGSTAFLLKLNAAGDAPTFSTFYSGNVRALALGGPGMAYIAGSASDLTAKNAYQAAPAGGIDSFIAEIDTAAATTSFATYFGGTGDDVIQGIAADHSGNIWVTGQTTSADLPQANSLQGPNTLPGLTSAFVAKFDPTATHLLFGTYFGVGYDVSTGTALTTDASGNAYVVGVGGPRNDYLLTNELQNNIALANYQGCFISKFSAVGAVAFSTLLSGNYGCNGVTLASNGRVAVTGSASGIGTALPLVDSVQTQISSGRSGFVTVLENDGSAISFSSYLGSSSGVTDMSAIAADGNGNVYVAGSSTTDYPLVGPVAGASSGTAGVVSRLNLATACTYQVNPTSVSGTAYDGYQFAFISVTAPDGCVWNATGPYVLGPPSGDWYLTNYLSSGSDFVILVANYSASANQKTDLVVAGHKVTVDLTGYGCTYTLQPSQITVPATGGFQTFTVNAGSGCPYTATSSVGWIHIGSQGNPVAFTVDVNQGAARQGSISVAGQIVTINQSAGPVPVLSISSTHSGNFVQGQIGATFIVTVTNAAGAGPTTGTVNVFDSVTQGISVTAIGGNGWICSPSGFGYLCSRSDPLNGGTAYPSIAVTVNVLATAGNGSNNASVSGGSFGGQANANDSVQIVAQATVTADSVLPASGSGQSQTFQLQYSSSAGGADLHGSQASLWVWITNNFNGPTAKSCMLYYTPGTSVLQLLKDDGSTWAVSASGTTALSNSQCSVDRSALAISTAGNTVTLSLPVTFTTSYPGTKSVYMFATDGTFNSGWQNRGAWTVPVTVTADSVLPASGSGFTQTFQYQFSSSASATDLATAWIWINNSFASTANSCMVYYSRANNQLQLLTDGGSIWTAGTIGGPGILSNSQCSINLSQAAGVPNGNSLTVSLPITFTSSFVGPKNVYMFASDDSGNSGWQTRGSWTVPATITADSVQPASASGIAANFILQYSSSAGATDLVSGWVWLTNNFSGPTSNSCMAYYNRLLNQVSLLTDGGNTWNSAAIGSSSALSNSQCSINLATATAVANGFTVTVTLPVTFTAAYDGAKSIFMFATDGAASSGWQNRGAFTVFAATVTADVVTPNGASGSAQTFALQYSSSAGASDITSAWVWIRSAASSSAANSCLAYYQSAGNQISLLTDGGSTWMPATLGSNATLSNSQCSINVAAASLATNGNALTLNLPVAFAPLYGGSKNIYMYANDSVANSGWQSRGMFTVAGPTITADSVLPASGSGMSQSFVLRYSSTAGGSDVSTAWVWISSSFAASAANSCMIYYNRALNQLGLLTDGGSVWSQASVGSAATLANSQCSVNLASVSAIVSGNSLELAVPISFSAAYGGAKNVYLYANDAVAGSGWQDLGTWTVPAVAVSADSVTPGSGSGTSQIFSLQYSSTLGATDLGTAWVWFNATFSGTANSCMVYYDRAANQVHLLNDDGATWSAGLSGSSGTLSNHQCSINLATTVAALNGNTLTVQLPVSFAAAFAGPKNVYLFANGSATNSGWQTRGAWTATAQ